MFLCNINKKNLKGDKCNTGCVAGATFVTQAENYQCTQWVCKGHGKPGNQEIYYFKVMERHGKAICFWKIKRQKEKKWRT